MSDLFKVKADDWDASQMRLSLSSAIGAAINIHVPLDPEMQVLDFGAGTGLLTAHIVPHVQQLTAVDTSPAMLEKLRDKPEFRAKVTTLCQDIITTPLAQKFDLIISAMAMHHVEDTGKLMRIFAGILHNGGRIALADLDKEDGSFHPAGTEGVFHHGFKRDALQDLLESSGFTDIEFFTAHTIEKENRQYTIFLVSARLEQ